MRIVTLIFLATLALSVVPVRGAEPLENGELVVLSEGRADYSPGEIAQIISEETPPHPVDGFYANPKLAALFSTAVFRVNVDGKTQEIPFRFRAPKSLLPGKRHPLIVVFHGKGESDDENSRQLAHLHYGLRSILCDPGADAFLVAPQCPAAETPSWYSRENRFGIAPIDYTQRIVAAMKRDFPIDPDRVSAFGVCAGANAALAVAQDAPDLFCALGLAGLAPGNLSPTTKTFPVPTWIFNNVDDDDNPIEPIRKLTRRMKSKGAPVYLTERTGKHDSWRRALRDDGVLTWLTTQRRGAMLAPPPGRVVRTQRSIEETTRKIYAPLGVFAAVYFALTLLLKKKLSATTTSKENKETQSNAEVTSALS